MTNEPAKRRSLFSRMLAGLLRPKFSLRTILVVMFVAAVASAWWSQRARVQQEVCRELTKRGISWELAQETAWYGRWLPQRVLKLGDGHWFRHLASVSYAPNGPNQQDDDLVLIARLPQVDELYLSWHGDKGGVEKVRALLSPLSQARGIDGISLNPFSMAMSEPSPSLSNPLFNALPPMPHLERLNLCLATLSIEELHSLERFPNLVELDLSQTSFDSDGVSHIARLAQLENLDLSHECVGDAQLHHLRSLRRIKQLRLDGNAITDQGLSDLASLGTLTELGLGDNPISGIAPLHRLRRLKRLDLSDTAITDAGLAGIEDFSQLEQLDLARSAVTSKTASHLLKAKNLQRLDLEECEIDDAAVTSLVRVLKLETLNIKKTQVSPAILAEINRCRTLKQVEITNLIFALPDILRSDPKVKFQGVADGFRLGLGHFDPAFPGSLDASLRLYGIQQVVGNLEPLRGNTTLTSVSFVETDITDEDLKVVGTLTQLTDLDLRSSKITDAGLAHLAGLVNLTRLDLSGSQVTRDGLQHLAAMQKLSHLRLTNLDLATGEANRWPALPGVTQLEISRTKLSANKPLPLSAFPNLTFLECRDTPIPAAALSELSQLPNLDYLLLGTVTDADLLVKSLAGKWRLTKLYFATDELSPDSFSVLRNLSALDTLSLSLKSLSVEQLSPLAGHPSLRIFWCDPAPWNPAFLPIAASLPKLAVFRSEGVILPDHSLSLLRGDPIIAGHTIEWRSEFGPFPTGSFPLPRGSNRIQSLTLQGIKIDESVLESISLLPGLKSVNLNRCELPENAGQYLAAMQDLVELQLRETRITPQLLADLEPLAFLTTLDLSGTEMTPEIVSRLVERVTLEELNLANTNISDTDAARLFTLPHLKELNLQGTAVTDAALANAVQARSLWRLDISKTRVSDGVMSLLKHHPSLQRLKTEDWWIGTKECDYYLRDQPRPDLTRLHLTRAELVLEPDGGLAKYKFLRELSTRNTGKVGELLELAAKHCPKLHSLQFVDEDISAGVLKGLPPSIQYVYFSNCRFSADAFDKLPAVHVRHFRFIDCPPSDVDLTGLSWLPSLRLVMFEGTSAASDKQVLQLSNCRQLRDVRMGMSLVGEEALLRLAALPTLRSLTVRSECLSPEACERIKQFKPWMELQ
jgi:internalin A